MGRLGLDGFAGTFVHLHPAQGGSFRLLAIPMYPFVATTAALPIFWFRRRLYRREAARRSSAGLCARCGYDLRGSPGRCPECGVESSSAESSTRQSALDDHRPRRAAMTTWAQWALAAAAAGAAVGVLAAAALLFLRLIVARPPVAPPARFLPPAAQAVP